MHRFRDAVIAVVATIALFVLLAWTGFVFGPFETIAVVLLGVALFAGLRVRAARRRG